MKKIAIVTVNHNSASDTKNLLKSLQKIDKENIDLHIFLIDNGSKEKFHLQSHDKNITLTRTEENLGFAGGFNLGIRQALNKNVEYILIINNDTEVYPDMLQKLLSGFNAGPDLIGVTVPKIYFAKGHEYHKDRYKENELGKVIWFAGGSTDWANIKSIHRGVDEVDHGQYDTNESIEFATGCCMLFKKEVLEKVGLFDERYFLYYEDADLSERIKKAGYKIYYIPRALLTHINAASTGGPGNTLHDYFLTRNQLLFGMTYAPLRSKIALLRQSLRLSLTGRPNQKKAIQDYYLHRFGEGTYFKK